MTNYKQPEGEKWTVLELHSLCSIAVNFSWGFTLILLSVIVPIIANSVSTFSKSSFMKGAWRNPQKLPLCIAHTVLEINEDKLPNNHKLLLIWIFLAIIHCSSIKVVSRSISAIWRIMLGLCVSPEAAIELISCLYSLCDCSGELLCWPCGETAGFPFQLGSTSTGCLSGWAVNKQPVTWRSQRNAWLTRWLKWLQTLIHFTASYKLESAKWMKFSHQ